MTALRAGDALTPTSIGPISQTDIVRFAGAGGDFNPLHHDLEVARAAGFERPIAMGQFSAGLVAAALSDWAGIAAVRRLEVRFRAPVPIGATLTITGAVTQVTDDIATLELAATRDDGVVAIVGSADVAAHRPDRIGAGRHGH